MNFDVGTDVFTIDETKKLIHELCEVSTEFIDKLPLQHLETIQKRTNQYADIGDDFGTSIMKAWSDYMKSLKAMFDHDTR